VYKLLKDRKPLGWIDIVALASAWSWGSTTRKTRTLRRW